MDTLSEEPVFVFIYYVSRSGSTFLMNELSKAKGVLTCPEGDILIDIFLRVKNRNRLVTINDWQKISNKLAQNEKMQIWRLDLIKLGYRVINKRFKDAFFQVLLSYAEAFNDRTDYIMFKSTLLINRELSIEDFVEKRKIKIISLIRDSRGIYASQKKFKLFPSGHQMADNPITVSYKWENHYKISLYYAHNDFFSIFLYEELIRNLDRVIIKIYHFIGLTFNERDSLLDGTHKMKIPVQQWNYHEKIGLPPISESINAWTKQLSRQEINIIEYLNGKEFKNLGYILTGEGVNLNFQCVVFLYRHIKFLLKRAILK